MPVSGNRDLREQILSAAKQLFIRQGYHALSMRQISEAVGVSKAALYYHFRHKEELFLAILMANLNEMEALIERIQAQEADSREQIRLLVHTILSQPAEQRAVIRLANQETAQLSTAARQVLKEVYQAKFIYKIQDILRYGMQAGELKQLDPAIATWTLLGMIYPYLYPAQEMEAQPRQEVIEQVVTIYLEGVAK